MGRVDAIFGARRTAPVVPQHRVVRERAEVQALAARLGRDVLVLVKPGPLAVPLEPFAIAPLEFRRNRDDVQLRLWERPRRAHCGGSARVGAEVEMARRLECLDAEREYSCVGGRVRRRHRAEKRNVIPDAKYGDEVLTKFMNSLMQY